MEVLNQQKAGLLYDFIDSSRFYHGAVEPEYRSIMNVTFKLKEPDLTECFSERASQNGLLALKGHRSVGGLRASIYNAMPIDGVKALVRFMEKFEKERG